MIGITGASGPLGRVTAELVLQSADPREVVLTTRTPETLADLAARGVLVRRADFGDPRTLTAAFEGVERLLLISTDAIGARLDQHRAAVSAAAEAGVSHLAYTSVPEPVAANPALVVADHAGTEQALRESGLRWTMLRNNLYAHMQTSVIEQAIASGRLVTNQGNGAAAYVTREDCAAAAAAVLTRGGQENKVMDITGPEPVSATDMVNLAREIGRRDIELIHVNDQDFAAGLRAAGLPEPLTELVTSFGASIRGGYLAHADGAVSDLTGREPRSFGDVVRASIKS